MDKRVLFSDLLKVDIATRTFPCEGKYVTDYPDIIAEMNTRQAILSNNFIRWEADKGIKWLFGYANFINQNSGLKVSGLVRRTYVTGDILSVDFFGGFNNELTYDHPAVVIRDLGHGLIVAPTTSNRTVFSAASGITHHVKLGHSTAVHGYMKKNSTIKLDNLRYISKNRILRVLKYEKVRRDGTIESKKQRISEPNKLKEIEVAIAMTLTPVLHKELVDKTTLITGLQQQLAELQEKNERLSQENLTLKERDSHLPDMGNDGLDETAATKYE